MHTKPHSRFYAADCRFRMHDPHKYSGILSINGGLPYYHIKPQSTSSIPYNLKKIFGCRTDYSKADYPARKARKILHPSTLHTPPNIVSQELLRFQHFPRLSLSCKRLTMEEYLREL